ncbi:hypothetical protein BGX33_008657 [Mortierella sp. NVP41]|nr:hypothetical protein BGX33_008657 [Mortierella sp. NVP41]
MEINPAVTFKHDRSVMYAKRPKVLIVGAGLGGLTLGMLLQQANIPYDIYERAPEAKPLGSAMYFNASCAPLFRQCEIYEEFVSVSKPLSSIKICNGQREVDYTIEFQGHEALFGADGYIIARPKLYDILLRQIPQERIHLGKKVLSIEQGGNGVLIRCSDGTEAEGDLLVGADGAYSAVRQNLYAKLQKANKLPAIDALPLPYCTVCLVGQTRPLGPSEFPDITLPECQFRTAVGANTPYAWKTFATKQNTICYIVLQFLDDESSKDNDAFRNSEWGPEAAAAMCEQVRDFPVISGGDNGVTMGDLIDWTPKEFISKVMLEEKFNPSGGVGAANAMHDAIVLANLINALPFHPIADEIEDAFGAYKKERIDWVKKAFDSSKVFRTMAGPKTPSVLIVGAGLGGVALGILLHKAGIHFNIFEKAPLVRPLGSAVSIGGQLIPLLAQLGLEEEFFKIAKPMAETRVHNEKRELNYVVDFTELEVMTGYKEHIVARPALYDLLVRQIPPERIHLNKRMLTKLEADDGIIIRMSDGSIYKGDILVGADGAYSTVRQRLYERLKIAGILCKSDREDLPFRSTCLVGQTRVLDPRDFPQLNKPLCDFYSTLGDKRPNSWMIFTTPQNTICWMVIHNLNKTSSRAVEDQGLKNAENSTWGPRAVQAMCDEARPFPIPGGKSAMTMGDLIDLTPSDLISKVFLEEKVFETWYWGRTVLLGDAAHKVNPSGGLGTLVAIHDAVALANLIYTLPSTSVKDINDMFSKYRSERYPAAMVAFQSSQSLSKTIDRGLSGVVARFVAKNAPRWIWRQHLVKRSLIRPLAAFLPVTESKGTIPPDPQPSFIEAKTLFDRRQFFAEL